MITSPVKDLEKSHIHSTSHKEQFQLKKRGFQKELENMGDKKSPVYLKEGPLPNRSCTDTFCLLLFLVLFVFQIFLFINNQAYKFNPLKTISKAHDYDHRTCGGEDRVNYNYIYFVSPTPDTLDRTVCVKHCPRGLVTRKEKEDFFLQCHPNSNVTSCDYTKNKYTTPYNQTLLYDTYHYSARVCLPSDPKLFNIVASQIQVDDIQEYIYNVQTALPLLVFSAILSLIIGFSLFWFLNYFPRATTWVFLFSILLFSGLVGFQMFLRANRGFTAIEDQDAYAQKIRNTSLGQENHKILLYIGAIVCWVISLVVLVVILIYYKQVKNLTNMLKISAIYAKHNWSVYFMPLIQFIVLICYFVFCLALIVSILKFEHLDQDNHFPFKALDLDKKTQFRIGLIALMFIFTARCLITLGEFIVQASSCLWYYAKEHVSNQESFVWKASYWAFYYQLGSLFFYAITSTLLYPFAKIIEFFYYKIMPYTFRDKNKCSYCLSLCCIYSCCCYNNFLMYLTHHSLVWMGMTGSGFIESSYQSYYLTKRNHHRLKSGETVNLIFRILGKLFLCLVSTFFTTLLLFKIPYFADKITDGLLPIILIILLSYTTGHFFIDIYASSADSLLVASFIDEEVELEHYGREFVYNCPSSIRPYIAQLHKQNKSNF